MSGEEKTGDGNSESESCCFAHPYCVATASFVDPLHDVARLFIYFIGVGTIGGVLVSVFEIGQ